MRDAIEHNVTVLPVDINASDWDCTLEAPDTVRLGFRQVKGLKSADMQKLTDARQRIGRFASVDQLQHETGFAQSVMKRLAEADAFGSVGLSRRTSLWQSVRATDSRSLRTSAEDDERPVHLPSMPIMQEVQTDYATIGLSLKQHPVGLVRDELRARKYIQNRQLADLPQGRWVKVAGLVLIRQRPGTASGIVFETIEDETGVANLIVMPQIFDLYRPATRHATFVGAEGRVERQGKVVHVHVRKMVDLTSLLSCEQRSRDFR